MDCLNLSYEEREKLLEKHPIVQKNYTLVTPTITNVYQVARERVWSRRTGTYLFARPRMGKSTCARTVKTALEKEFSNIFVLLFSAERRKQSDSGVLIDILNSASLVIAPRTSYKDLFNRLMTHIETTLKSISGNQFVLIIDEMQLLSEADLNVLFVLHNRLELRSIKMTTLSFAQSDIEHLRSALYATHALNLLGRFLTESIPFDGCSKIEDLEMILKSYDDDLFFPDDSEYTYTHFFLPEAYSNGFRLKHSASLIWKSLKKASEPLNESSIPMEHLFRTIEYLLLMSRNIDSDKFEVSQAMINNAVDASNLKEFCNSMMPHAA